MPKALRAKGQQAAAGTRWHARAGDRVNARQKMDLPLTPTLGAIVLGSVNLHHLGVLWGGAAASLAGKQGGTKP